MSDTIYTAIRRMALEGMSVADVGVASHVDAEKGKCDVAIEGKAPAKGAWLSCGGSVSRGIVTVPKEGSDVVVVWMSASVAVVVMVAEVDKIVLRGGERGGLVDIDKLTDKINALVDAFNCHTHTIVSGGVVTAGSATTQTNAEPISVPAVTSKADKLESGDYEDETFTH